MTVAAVASLVVGIVIGFVGQRSRMCFVGGIRDWILVRDTFLLKGLIAFILVSWVLFPLAPLVGGEALGSFGVPVTSAIVLTAVGGFGVGDHRKASRHWSNCFGLRLQGSFRASWCLSCPNRRSRSRRLRPP